MGLEELPEEVVDILRSSQDVSTGIGPFWLPRKPAPADFIPDE